MFNRYVDLFFERNIYIQDVSGASAAHLVSALAFLHCLAPPPRSLGFEDLVQLWPIGVGDGAIEVVYIYIGPSDFFCCCQRK